GFAQMLLNRYHLSTATSLERSGPIILVIQKILQRSEEKCAKPTLLSIRTAQCVLLEQMGEKALDQILRICGGMTAVAKKAIERRPIWFAKSRKRFVSGGLSIRFPAPQPHGPMRRLKRSTACLEVPGNGLGGYRASLTTRDFARIKSRAGSVVAAVSAAREF